MIPLAAQDDQPSLGDVARQSRLQKQKNKDAAAGKDGQPAASAPAAAEDKPAVAGDAQKADSGATAHEAKKTPSGKPAKKVITNDEVPSHVGPTRILPPTTVTADDQYEEPQPTEGAAPADYWRTRILSQKNSIAAMKSDIGELSASIQYAGADCVSNCAEWNERQRQKQQQVESMKAQLEQEEKKLEEMQDMARKQGYGNSVYDP